MDAKNQIAKGEDWTTFLEPQKGLCQEHQMTLLSITLPSKEPQN